MGASSVTGTGKGSVEKYGGGKGPGNLRTTGVPMQTPHIVAASTAAIAGSATGATVNLTNPLPLPAASYVVAITPSTALASMTVTKNNNTAGTQMTSFTVACSAVGASGASFDWMVARAGQGLETQTSWIPTTGFSVDAPAG